MTDSIAEVARIAAGLTKAQREQLALYQPNVFYGTACPAGASPSVKGRLTTLGILRRIWLREVGGSADHALTPLGEQVRAHLMGQAS